MSLTHAYAALFRDADTVKTVTNALAYMKAKGHLSLLPVIVRMLEREPSKGARVVVAKESDAKKFKKEIEASLREIGEDDHVVVVDPNLVAGFSVRGKSKSIDRSYRSALVSLYHRVID